MAQDPEAGDEVLRLGFEVHGTIAYDRPTDVDTYSFQGYPGTEVWMAIDRTSFSLDTVLELVDANGTCWPAATTGATTRPSGDCPALGRRLGLRGRVQHEPQRRRHARGAARLGEQQRTYYLRVSSAPPAFSGTEQTYGQYQLQIRLQPVYEHPGSTVQYADIRYATNGIDVSGLPDHSVLTTDVYDTEGNTTANSNDTWATAQPAGNLLQSDQGMINIGGYLSSWTDVDWYKFSVDYGNTIERITGVTTTGSVYPVVLDLDFADGLVRPDTTLWLFDGGTVANPVTPTLIYSGTNSNIVDDQAGLGNGSTDSILTSGTYGANDPYIGPIYLMEGHVYYVAVTTAGDTADGGNPTLNPSRAVGAVDSITAVAKDYVGSQGSAPYTLFPGTTNQQLNLAATPLRAQRREFLRAHGHRLGHGRSLYGDGRSGQRRPAQCDARRHLRRPGDAERRRTLHHYAGGGPRSRHGPERRRRRPRQIDPGNPSTRSFPRIPTAW